MCEKNRNRNLKKGEKMITSEHIKEEIEIAKKIVESKESSSSEKLKALFKIIIVLSKIATGTRQNTVQNKDILINVSEDLKWVKEKLRKTIT